jgi:hypothetical protein
MLRLRNLPILAALAVLLGTLPLHGCDPCPSCTGSAINNKVLSSSSVTQIGLFVYGGFLPTTSAARNSGSSSRAQANPTATATPAGIVAYVSRGASTPGIEVVPLRPGPIYPTLISTTEPVNSCAVDQTLGEVVCTGTGTDIYLVGGDYLLDVLTSSATSAGASDDNLCMNCGVVVDSIHHDAILSIGTGTQGGATGAAYQVLDLTTNTLGSPIPVLPYAPNGYAVDGAHQLIVSPSSASILGLFNISNAAAPAAYNADLSSKISDAELDSAAIDTTGVAIAGAEFTGDYVLSNLTESHKTAGTPGTWSGPTTVQNLPEVADSFQTGATELSLATGSHLAVIADENATPSFGVLKLPSQTVSGAPKIQDYAIAQMPYDPSDLPWSTGPDPHAVTAFALKAALGGGAITSGTARGFGFLLTADSTYIAVVDLDALLNAPRLSGTHTVDPAYDLLGNNVVIFVPMGA